MASRYKSIPLMKFVATGVGSALCEVEVLLNAEHIAHVEGWASSMVAAVVVASIGAAAALPLATRMRLLSASPWRTSYGRERIHWARCMEISGL